MSSDSRFVPLVLKTDTEPNMIKSSTSSACKFFTVVFVFALITFSSYAQDISTDPAAISAGEALFSANCKACHRVDKVLVGPALKDVHNRAPSIDWIKSFIKNSSGVIASGDDYAVKLYNQYNKTQMTAFTSLKDAPTAGTGTTVSTDSTPAGYLNVILIGMVIILILLLVILGFLVSALKRFLDSKNLSEEDKEVVHSPITGSSMVKSSAFIFIVAFLVTGLGFKAVINGLYSIGVQQGYAPKQPIAFSHKIHAGDLEIDCKYCHVGVMKNKNATIPSVNICMNCHNRIQEGTQTGKGEIAKIVKAFETNKPIEWVRIHNLPDLAYFNHAQHVNVGGIECQTCHGPIETMEVVRQNS
jgi:mono/diheme cytochrome c family protein